VFAGWENFYLLVGGASGSLIGLMFVATTLTAGLEPSRVSRGAMVYFSPIVFHFAVVLLVSALALAPQLRAVGDCAFLEACAVVGLVYAIATTVRVLSFGSENPPHWSDRYFYGYAPTLAYVALALAAAAAPVREKESAAGVAIVILALLMLGVRNAWDLATFLVQQPRDRPDAGSN